MPCIPCPLRRREYLVMAGNSDSGRNNRIIGELLDRVEQLSEAISTRANSEVNEEVRRVFGSNRGRGDDTINTGNTNSESPETARASQATSSRQDALPVRRGGVFGVRRYFPTRQRPSSSIRRTKNSARPIDNKPFLRDLILLSGPNETTVPRQGVRVLLSDNGHVVTACQFTKGMSETQIETKIIEAFDGKIPDAVDIELLMSVHTALVKPTLAPGQRVDGIVASASIATKDTPNFFVYFAVCASRYCFR